MTAMYWGSEDPFLNMMDETFEREDYEASKVEDRAEEVRFWTEMGYRECGSCGRTHHLDEPCHW